MPGTKQDLVFYRLARAKETYDDAKILADNKKWNSSINRLYYAAYYTISALLLNNGHKTTTHSGVKTNFSLYFIKTGIIEKENLYLSLQDFVQT